jgi:hypothetical protein
MSYTVITPNIPPRAADMLHKEPWTATVVVGQDEEGNDITREAEYEPTYGMIAPGLYPDEDVVQFDDGTVAARSVEETFIPTTLGVSLCGFLRWINPDGSTRTTPDGAHVETALVVGASREQIADRGLAAYRDEVKTLMCGGAPTMVPIENPVDAVPLTQEQIDAATVALQGQSSPNAELTLDPGATEAPLISVPAEQLAAADIRSAIAVAAQMQGFDPV